MHIIHGAATHVGQRHNNEDSYCCDGPTGLFAVADGMGGYEGGEVASQLAVKAMATLFRRMADDDDVTWPCGLDPNLGLDENLLAVAVYAADESIKTHRSGRLASMGSTVAAVAVRDDRAVIAHVGDSRVYRLRHGALEALTRDHSLYNDMVAAGMVVPSRAAFPHGNVITRALGMKGKARPDVRTESLRPGDVYLVCSDGMEPVPETEVADALARQVPQAAADHLVQRAYTLGGKDNITAVVFRADR